MKVQLTKEIIDFLDYWGTIVNIGDNKYQYMPLWFKTNNSENVHEVLTFENLPKELKDWIDIDRQSHMTPLLLEQEIRLLLHGIDMDECENDEGWWETSTGAEFGEKKLEQLLALIKKRCGESSFR